MTRNAIARLVSYPDGGRSWVVDRCPYCGKRHSHGAGGPGGDPQTFLGHRVAHCVGEHGQAAGYVLVEGQRSPGNQA